MSVRFRGTESNEVASFSEAVSNGSPRGGGLFIPTTLPKIEFQNKENWAELAFRMLQPWIGNEITSDVQRAVAANAFAFDLRIVDLEGAEYDGISVLELFHGPTGSFKDVGARWLANILSHILVERQERRRILVATSGDTGGAVADAFADKDGIEVVLLFPRQGVSDIQRKQLTLTRSGVVAFEVDGVFDDCQRLVKEALAARKSSIPLSSANSISVGRLLPQMTYYAWAAQQLRDKHASAPTFVVPSGNLGNLTAGLMADGSCNLNASFAAAHNANDSFGRFRRGEQVNEPSIQTISNAMDVGSPSNLIRIQKLLGIEAARTSIDSYSVSDEQTRTEIALAYSTTGYLCDPHTAVGLCAAKNVRDGASPVVVLGTAHPAKFPRIVANAVGIEPPLPDTLLSSITGETSVNHCDHDGRQFFEYIAAK